MFLQVICLFLPVCSDLQCSDDGKRLEMMAILREPCPILAGYGGLSACQEISRNVGFFGLEQRKKVLAKRVCNREKPRKTELIQAQNPEKPRKTPKKISLSHYRCKKMQ